MIVFSEGEQPSAFLLWDRIQQDPQYKTMFAFLKELKPQYESVLSKLPSHEQDIIADYISACEVMNWRALEYICENLTFEGI